MSDTSNPVASGPSLSARGHTFEAKLGDNEWFTELRPLVYANYASVAPPSTAVRHAVLAALDDYAKHGVDAAGRWMRQRRRLRAKLAELIGARPEEVALVPNTSRGVTDVALCFPWRRGDRVILFEGEFPANVTPWQRAAELFELEVTFLSIADYLEDEGRALGRLEAALGEGARVVAVSAVQFASGLRMPLAEMSRLAHAAGAELFVDAIQACGIVPIDVGALGVDYLACGGHKWMMGVEGAGFLYARAEAARALRPAVAGWLSHEDPFEFLVAGAGHLRYDRPLRSTVDVVEGGVANVLGYAALEAGLDLIRGLGPQAIFEHVQRYHDALEAGLVERGCTSARPAVASRRSGILSVLPPPGVSVVELKRGLGELGVSCATPDGYLRFSPHWPNAVDEVEQVLVSFDEARRRMAGESAPSSDDW